MFVCLSPLPPPTLENKLVFTVRSEEQHSTNSSTQTLYMMIIIMYSHIMYKALTQCKAVQCSVCSLYIHVRTCTYMHTYYINYTYVHVHHSTHLPFLWTMCVRVDEHQSLRFQGRGSAPFSHLQCLDLIIMNTIIIY